MTDHKPPRTQLRIIYGISELVVPYFECYHTRTVNKQSIHEITAKTSVQ